MEEHRDHEGHRHESRKRKSSDSRARYLRSWPLWLLLLVMTASGCARARASTVPAAVPEVPEVTGGPPLDVPAPPPRVVLPLAVEFEAPEPAPTPEDPRPTPPRQRGATTPADAPAPSGPTAVDEAPRQPSLPPPASATLQTTPAAEQGEVERAIRTTMARASAGLDRIDYRALNADARMQYNTARRFIEQAEEAIRIKNLPFAKNLADKADVLMTQLPGG